MKKFYVLCTFLCCLFLQQTFAQVRYVDEVFTDAELTIMKDIPYATNMTVLAQIFDPNVDVPVPQPLAMDIYMPSMDIDDARDRPVVIIPHSENLPRYATQCAGAKDDLASVNQATRLAKMGYVAVTVEGRLGWNPLENNSNGFIRQLSRAVIRRAIENRTVARLLRKDVAENGNSYGIHPDKFVIWGSNNAGTIGLYTAYILVFAEIFKRKKKIDFLWQIRIKV